MAGCVSSYALTLASHPPKLTCVESAPLERPPNRRVLVFLSPGVGQPEAVPGQKESCLLVPWVRAGEPVKGSGVVWVGQVRHLVHQHRVEHPLRYRPQAVRDPDVA